MGKRDRLKRSPSHSNTNLSLKELKEFVTLTSNPRVAEDEENDLAISAISHDVAPDGEKDVDKEDSIIGVQKELGSDVPVHSPSNGISPNFTSHPNWYANMQARLNSIKSRFAATSEVSSDHLSLSKEAGVQTQGVHDIEEGSKVGLDQEASKVGSQNDVVPTSNIEPISVGDEDDQGVLIEGSNGEAISFVSLQDSCELARKKKETKLNANAASNIDPTSVGVEADHGVVMEVSNGKAMSEFGAGSKSLSLETTTLAQPHGPSKFEHFLMEVLQAENQNGVFSSTGTKKCELVDCLHKPHNHHTDCIGTNLNRRSFDPNGARFDPPNVLASGGKFHASQSSYSSNPVPLPSVLGSHYNGFSEANKCYQPEKTDMGSFPLVQRNLNPLDKQHVHPGYEVSPFKPDLVEKVGRHHMGSLKSPPHGVHNHGMDKTVGGTIDGECPSVNLVMEGESAPQKSENPHLVKDNSPLAADRPPYEQNASDCLCITDCAYRGTQPITSLSDSANTLHSVDQHLYLGACGHSKNVLDSMPAAHDRQASELLSFNECANRGTQPIHGSLHESDFAISSLASKLGSHLVEPTDKISNSSGIQPKALLPCSGSSSSSNPKLFSQLFSASRQPNNFDLTVNEDHCHEVVPLPESFPLDFISHGSRSENLILPVPKALTDEGKEEWESTLVGYFIGKNLPYSLVKSSTDRLWTDFGVFDTLATDNGFYFFTFSNEATRDAVLVGGPWYIAGRPFILQPWKPNLKLDKEGVQSLPIWVNFFGIPLEFWNPKGISFIASFIGKPLRVDKMTASRRRITYARVCIEVSGDQDLIERFALETENDNGTKNLIDISVEYQWLPPRCSKCSTFGHNCLTSTNARPNRLFYKASPSQSSFSNCKYTMPQQWVPVKKSVDEANLKVNHTNESQDEGLWTEVTRKGKGKVVAPKEVQESPRQVSQAIPPTSAQQVKISNSFNHLIPYVYDVRETDHSQDDFEAPVDKEDMVQVDLNVEKVTDSPQSSRQKKREAKMHFSMSRPKGRHRS